MDLKITQIIYTHRVRASNCLEKSADQTLILHVYCTWSNEKHMLYKHQFFRPVTALSFRSDNVNCWPTSYMVIQQTFLVVSSTMLLVVQFFYMLLAINKAVECSIFYLIGYENKVWNWQPQHIKLIFHFLCILYGVCFLFGISLWKNLKLI